MPSEVSADMLSAAHELNVRDAKIADLVDANDGTYEQQKENFPDDETIWEESSGPRNTAAGPYPVSAPSQYYSVSLTPVCSETEEYWRTLLYALDGASIRPGLSSRPVSSARLNMLRSSRALI